MNAQPLVDMAHLRERFPSASWKSARRFSELTRTFSGELGIAGLPNA
jgi:hypothetical protein